MNILLSHQPVVISGGAERATLDLGAALVHLGHVVFLWGPWHSCPTFVDIAKEAGVEILTQPSRSYVGEIAALRAAVRTRRIDMILSDGRRYNALSHFAILGLPARHVPVLRSVPSMWDEPRKKSLSYRIAVPFWNAFWLHMLRRSAQIICVSNSVAMDAQKLLRLESSRTRVIYDAIGISTCDSGASLTGKARIPFKLILVGRLQPVKHFERIIPLVQEIKRLGEDVVAEIAGSGECRDDLLKAIQIAGLQNEIKLLGHRADVISLYKGAHILVHFCEQEACARVYLEAQMNGLPVVCVAGGGTAELVRNGETGFIHAYSELPKMAASILRLKRENSLYDIMSTKARNWASRFIVHEMALQYEAVFKSMLGEHSPEQCNALPEQQLQIR